MNFNVGDVQSTLNGVSSIGFPEKSSGEKQFITPSHGIGVEQEDSSYKGVAVEVFYLGQMDSQIDLLSINLPPIPQPIKEIDGKLFIEGDLLQVKSWNEVEYSGTKYLIHMPERGIFELYEVGI